MSLIRQRGAGSVEIVVIMLLFVALITGLFEMTRVFRTKHTLNTATFMAARAGALHHARKAPMESELARAMAPAYLFGQRDSEGVARAVSRSSAMTALPGIGAEIVSPTRQIFDALARTQRIRRSDESEFRWQHVIPNDNLRYRPREMAPVDTEDGTRQINLQDANLLRIRSLWCHRLVVPGLDRLVFDLVNQADVLSQRQAICSAISDRDIPGVTRGYYLAVTADAVVRMQSAVVADDLI